MLKPTRAEIAEAAREIEQLAADMLESPEVSDDEEAADWLDEGDNHFYFDRYSKAFACCLIARAIQRRETKGDA